MSDVVPTTPTTPTTPGWPAESRVLAGLALAVVAAWALTSILGGREATSVLTGTAPATGQAMVLGALHVATHMLLVVAAPILALAALLRAALERLTPPRSS